jgi:hypothetical protein
VESAETVVATATDAHVQAPDEKRLAAAALAAEGMLSLARKRHAAAQAKATRTDEALAGAARARELAQRDVRKSELRPRCSPQALAEAIEEPSRALVAAAEAFRDAFVALRKAHADSVDASKELRSLGSAESDLHQLHVAAPFLRLLAQRGLVPSGYGPVPRPEDIQVHFRADVPVERDFDSMAQILRHIVLAQKPAVDYAAPAFEARLAKAQTCRNLYELEALEIREEKARAAGAPAPLPLPPPAERTISDRMTTAKTRPSALDDEA